MSFQTLLALIKRYFIFIILTVWSISVHGQGKNFSISRTEPVWKTNIQPKEKRPPAKDISDGYFLSFYENQNHVELQEDYNHIIREIVSDAGVQNGSQISVTYDPDFQKLIFHKVTIWRDGQPSDRLKASGFKVIQSEKELSRFIYSGTNDAIMVLDDVRKGDRIEFSYTIKGSNPIFGKKYASRYYFEGSSSIGHIYTNVIFNKSRSLKYKNFNFKDAPKTTETSTMKRYEWESTLTKTHRIADFEPSWYNPLQHTQLSEYNSWSEVVDWALAVNDYPNLTTPMVNRKVAEFKKLAGKDQKKYIELATRFVKDEIRYMGIEIGAYSHRPNSPEKVLIQRYGDCKDKSLLLVNLLKANNIEAYMTYADTEMTLKTSEYLPSPFIFNHVIVMVQMDNKKTWIDPTIAHQRGKFGDYYAPNYGNVLVIKKGVNALEKMESKLVGKLISNLTFKLADTLADAVTTLNIFSVYRDNYADNMRSQIAESGADDLEKSFTEYYKELYPELETHEAMIIEDHEDGNVIEITESYDITDIWSEKEEKKDRYAYFYGDLISTILRKISDKKRKSPLALDPSVNIEQNVTVEVPYQMVNDDDHFSIQRDEYTFELYMTQVDSMVRFSYTYNNIADHIDQKNIKTYIKDLKDMDEYLSYTLNRGTYNSGSGENPVSKINLYTLIAYLLSTVLASIICFKLYAKEDSFDIQEIADAPNIGGWLYLLAVRVALFPLGILINVFTVKLFDKELWHNLNSYGNLEIALKGAFLIQSSLFAILFIYSIYCAILFFERRKEFPKHFINISIYYVAFVIFDAAVGAYINYLNDVTMIKTSDITNLIRAFFYSVATVLYLSKSERVKETFVFTYPRLKWQKALMEHYSRLFTTKKETTNEDI